MDQGSHKGAFCDAGLLEAAGMSVEQLKDCVDQLHQGTPGEAICSCTSADYLVL